MGINKPQFPDSNWDGKTPARLDRTIDKAAETEDWDQISAEVISLQRRMMFGGSPNQVVFKSSSYTLSTEDDGKTFYSDGVVVFTLPPKIAGLTFKFFQPNDAVLEIIGNADIIHKGSANATSVAFITAGQKLGSYVIAECVDVQGTLKWLISNLGGTTATVT